ncbi:MAG: sortase [Streptococcaceae bacterium]|jgi:LPXTG-site transpeptidase (sortase) family protein|nr:sortase [Streptococcaceae bacterium]
MKKAWKLFASLTVLLVAALIWGFASLQSEAAAMKRIAVEAGAYQVTSSQDSPSRGIIFGLLTTFGEDGGVSQLQAWQAGESEPALSTTNSTYQPYTLYFLNETVPFANTGASGASSSAQSGDAQNYINSHPENAATYGGTKVFSGTDNFNTEFVAHDGGAFNNLNQLHLGDKITVTDNTATPYMYQVNDIETVDSNHLTLDQAQAILDFGWTERITLQTCVGTSAYRLIIYANRIQ